MSEYAQVAKNLDALANYLDTLLVENPFTSRAHGKFTLSDARVPGAKRPDDEAGRFKWVARSPRHAPNLFEEGEFIRLSREERMERARCSQSSQSWFRRPDPSI